MKVQIKLSIWSTMLKGWLRFKYKAFFLTFYAESLLLTRLISEITVVLLLE